MKTTCVYLLVAWLTALGCLTAVQAGDEPFLTLCYHDLPLTVVDDPYGVDITAFAEQLDYLKSHGHHFISVDDVRQAEAGGEPLPAKSLMVTVDDAYISFYSNAVAVLELYECPVLLAACAKWMDAGAPPDIAAPLMSWEQLKELEAHPLVTVASHSYDLHRTVQYNPQGNTGHAAISRTFLPAESRYETEAAYRQRIADDFVKARDSFTRHVGKVPTVIVWPYGRFNQITVEEATRAGYDMAFGLARGGAPTSGTMAFWRWMLMGNPSIGDFIDDLEANLRGDAGPGSEVRAVQVDLDLIYDPDPVQMERNLGKFLDRLVALKPSTVILQGFADPDGDGTIDAVYFPNTILPMRADLLNRVSNQLSVRGFEIFIWLPLLAIELPDEVITERLAVRELKSGKVGLSSSWYRRLSPFAPETRTLVRTLYEEMAAHVRLDGVLFQDDAYLTDFEDYHPAAIEAYREVFAHDPPAFTAMLPEARMRWTSMKTGMLNAFTEELMTGVRARCPHAKFARNLYAPVLETPQAEEWFAQNYRQSLDLYDYVVLMTYPEHEGVRFKKRWLEKLVGLAAEHPRGLDRTIFKLQAYDWKAQRWIKSRHLHERMRWLSAAGARHLAYYPDDYTANQPALRKVRLEMSVRDELFRKPVRRRPTTKLY